MQKSRLKKSKQIRREPAPDRRQLGEQQARRLAALAGLDVKELVGKTVAELSETLRFRVDADILLFRRVCGRVVKTDPVTGEQFPVPFATVHVEDTDCHFLGYFPAAWPWS